MQNPVPFISYGTFKMEKEVNDKKITDYIDRITTPIFNKVLQESNLNPMMVGGVQETKPIKWLWQPHNYRIYVDFDKKTFKSKDLNKDNRTLQKLKVRLVGFEYGTKNHNSEHHFNNFYGCRIVIKKKIAEITNKSHNKQWRLMTANNIDDIGARIDEVVNRLDNQCIESLKKLIRLFGGSSNFKTLNKAWKGEHGVKGIDFLDQIPEDMVIHDTVFKKVYKKKVEYKSPVHVKNTVTNYAIKNIAPEIADELSVIREIVRGTLEVNADTSKMINNMVRGATPTLAEFHSDVKVHNKVLKGIEKAFNKFNKKLSQTDLRKYL